MEEKTVFFPSEKKKKKKKRGCFLERRSSVSALVRVLEAKWCAVLMQVSERRVWEETELNEVWGKRCSCVFTAIDK